MTSSLPSSVTTPLIHQSEYAKTLRPLLPDDAFVSNRHKVHILLINLAILVLGWGIARSLDQWPAGTWIAYLPLTVIMANSVIVMLFATHDILHSAIVKNPILRRSLTLVSLAFFWMPPTLWINVHNRVHHTHTNDAQDPDRNYLFDQPATWGKRIQHLFVPSTEVHPVWLVLGTCMAWGVHTFRNLSSVVFFNRTDVAYVPAAFQVSRKDRRSITLEWGAIAIFHLAVMAYLNFDPLKLLLAYFLPIALGNGGTMFYIYTNHMFRPMMDTNDPLMNSVSIRVPKLFDLLHFNFSYHAEHHIFPGVNSDYYPFIQKLLQAHYPDRAGYVIDAKTAWQTLLNTPRHYLDAETFTTWRGDRQVPCPTNEVIVGPGVNSLTEVEMTPTFR